MLFLFSRKSLRLSYKYHFTFSRSTSAIIYLTFFYSSITTLTATMHSWYPPSLRYQPPPFSTHPSVAVILWFSHRCTCPQKCTFFTMLNYFALLFRTSTFSFYTFLSFDKFLLCFLWFSSQSNLFLTQSWHTIAFTLQFLTPVNRFAMYFWLLLLRLCSARLGDLPPYLFNIKPLSILNHSFPHHVLRPLNPSLTNHCSLTAHFCRHWRQDCARDRFFVRSIKNKVQTLINIFLDTVRTSVQESNDY